MTSGHINAEWRLNECARMGGNSSNSVRKESQVEADVGPRDKALRGLSMAKPEASNSFQTYLTYRQAQSQAAAGSREERHFQKSHCMQGVGLENFLYLTAESLSMARGK